MNFSDVFKNSFLTQIKSNHVMDIIIAVLASILAGVYIFYFYKKLYKGVMFSKMFGVALAAMTVITTKNG